MATKRLILLLDGTWNDADKSLFQTNIVRLRDLIAKTLENMAPSDNGAALDFPVGSYGTKIVSGFTAAGLENYVFYERGVGTGFLDQFRGGVFGAGLPTNIRRAYKFLARWYEPGDQIFIFGFSRGAFTARSLVGYLSSSGLLTREDCTPENEILAWNYYRTAPYDRLPGQHELLRDFVHDRDKLRVSCVGVFDTVGALGIPADFASRFNRARYEFHDVDLSSITQLNLHALAIDEHRKPFQATLWRKPKFRKYGSCTEQVWFPGAHADIGGGYVEEGNRKIASLDDISFAWMLTRIKHYFPDFPCELDIQIREEWSLANQHQPRRFFYKLMQRGLRSIANCSSNPRRWRYECQVSKDRNTNPIGEMIHISALERLGKRVAIDSRIAVYSPQNLVSVIPHIQATYSIEHRGLDNHTQIRVVDWSSRILHPTETEDRLKVQRILAEAQKRLGLPILTVEDVHKAAQFSGA